MSRPYLIAALLIIGSASAQVTPRISKKDGGTVATFSADAAEQTAFSNAPYAAKQSLNMARTLANGVHLSGDTRLTSIWQDSQGRRRIEQQYDASGLATIAQILDPVEGAIYVLDPVANVAHRFKATFRVNHVLTSGSLPQGLPPTTIKTPEGGTFTNESLGIQVISGLTAYGTRSTRHYPAGSSVGNDKAYDVINEFWYAPLVGSTVLSKSQDPRWGDNAMRLDDVIPGEPDPSLLRPPVGYRVVDESDAFKIQVK